MPVDLTPLSDALSTLASVAIPVGFALLSSRVAIKTLRCVHNVGDDYECDDDGFDPDEPPGMCDAPDAPA